MAASPLMPAPMKTIDGFHTEQDYLTALFIYAETGSVYGTSKATGIRAEVVERWIMDPKGKEKLIDIRKAVRMVVATKALQCSVQALNAVQDRLAYGDVHVTKQDEVIRIPVNAKDAAMIARNLQQMHSDLSGSLTAQAQSDNKLLSLASALGDILAKQRSESPPPDEPVKELPPPDVLTDALG